jgi:four helix bundle suffix protein
MQVVKIFAFSSNSKFKSVDEENSAGYYRRVAERFIPQHGGYERLLSFQKARAIYDATVWFCGRYLRKGDRTNDQMIQAARSGKQNILGASLEELLEDYRDYLRVRGLRLWEKNSREATFVRKLGRTENVTYGTYRTYIETRSAEVAANIIICLIHQTNYLLDQQIRKLEKAFVTEGGLSERMTRARLTERKKKKD